MSKLTPKKPDTEVLLWLKDRLDYHTETGQLFWAKGRFKGKEAGWVDQHGYRILRTKGNRLLRNHHVIWYLETGEWPTQELDHIDNNPSNNRFDNLRLADRQKQGSNQSLQKGRSGKYKGVHQSTSGKFYVKIKVKGEQKYFGSYETEEEAAKVYNAKAQHYFGNWANLNQGV